MTATSLTSVEKFLVFAKGTYFAEQTADVLETQRAEMSEETIPVIHIVSIAICAQSEAQNDAGSLHTRSMASQELKS